MSDAYPFTIIKQEIARRNGKALDFAVGVNPFPLSPELRSWLKEHSELALLPGKPDDIARFAEAASVYLQEQFDLALDPRHILPTAGGRAAMGILAACTLQPNDSVIVTEPGYPAFARLAVQRGAKLLVSHLDPQNGFAPDFEYSERAPAGSVSMLAVNYPNNPSGSTLSPLVLERLRKIAEPGLVIFNDATYGPLVYGEKPCSLMSQSFATAGGSKCVELHSFSKLYPIGPLAVSFLTGSADLMEQMSTYSEYAWSPLSCLQLAATAKCLEDRERIDWFVSHIPQQMRSLKEVLEDAGFVAHDANSGTYILCDAPTSIAGQAVSSAQAAAKLLMDDFDIAVVPLGTDEKSFLRFSAQYRPQDLERLTAMRTDLRIQ
jgi:aspartate/methionine/tyrosine aminotransferase